MPIQKQLLGTRTAVCTIPLHVKQVMTSAFQPHQPNAVILLMVGYSHTIFQHWMQVLMGPALPPMRWIERGQAHLIMAWCLAYRCAVRPQALPILQERRTNRKAGLVVGAKQQHISRQDQTLHMETLRLSCGCSSALTLLRLAVCLVVCPIVLAMSGLVSLFAKQCSE